MEIKRVLSLSLGITGIILAIFSLTMVQKITGAVVGVNPVSKYLGFIGLLFMILAVVISRYERRTNK